MSSILEYFKNIKVQIVLCLLAIIIGIITGAIDALFGIVLGKLTTIREMHNVYFLICIPLGALLVSYVFQKYGGKCKKGMGLVFEVESGKEKDIPLLLIPFVVCGTWISHLVGGSAGREGVAMQIGATVSNWFADKIHLENASKYLLPIGLSAGFAGLFQTPIASVLFAMEVLIAGEIRYPIFLPSLVSAYVAASTSSFLGLSSSTISFSGALNWNAKTMIFLVLMGILFGIVGDAFSFCMHTAQHKAASLFLNPIRKSLVLGTIVAILLIVCHCGRYSGAGGNLITMAINHEQIYMYDWILKFGLTILTMCSGLMGGEVVPLFTIGATLGAVVGPIFGIDSAFAAMLGYAAVFSSGTNTFFAAIFVGSEIFGFTYMPYFFIVCAVSYICNKNHSIYGLQKSVFPRIHKK